MTQSQPTQSEKKLFKKINNYAEQFELELKDFWKSNRFCLTIDEFIGMLDDVKVQVRSDEIISLQNDNVEFISLEKIINCVPYWKEKEKSVADYLTHSRKAEEKKISKKQIIETDNRYSIRKDSKISKINTPLYDEKTVAKKNLEKQLKKEVTLNQTLIRARNQSDYQTTIKVGELNDICKRLNNGLSYLIKSESYDLKIMEINNSTEVVITKKAFEKRYEKLKLQNCNKIDEIEGSLEEDLRKTLIEVMHNSHELQEQMKVLYRKGVKH